VNYSPVIDCMPTLNITANEEYRFLPDISDIENDSLTVTVENLPEWLTLDSATGELIGTPTNAQAAVYNNIQMSVSDGSIKSQLPTFSIEVTYSTLEAPVNLQQVTSSKEKLQEIQLSWDKVEFAKSYTVEISLFEDFRTILQTETTEHNKITLEKAPNLYYWRVNTVNPNDVAGLYSEVVSLEAGVFTRSFGGVSSESLKKTVLTNDGSYVTLASTNSLDLNSNLNDEDDWIFKVNSQGQMEWEFFYIGAGRDRLTDFTILKDGSVLAIGQDWETQKAILLKLSPEGNKVWEKIYRPEGYDARYDFSKIIEVNNKVYVVAFLWKCSENECHQDVAKLHSIDVVNSEISDPIQLPDIQGSQIDPKLFKAGKDNKILLFGNNYIVVLNDDLSLNASWHIQSPYEAMVVSDIIELNNGTIALVGAEVMHDFSAVVTLVDNKGKLLKQQLFPDLEVSGAFKLVESEQNHVSFAVNQNGQVSIVKLDQSLNILEEKLHYNSADSKPSIYSILLNSDGTQTISLTDSSIEKSIVIIKK